MWDALRLDVRHSFRSLRRAPTFSLIVIVTLTLAVGATTAVGSLLNALVLRTLAVPSPEQLVALSALDPRANVSGYFYADTFNAYRSAQRSFAQMSMYSGGGLLRVETRSGVFDAWTEAVSPNYFDIVGARLSAGRFFTDSDDAVVVISEGFRRRIFGEWSRHRRGDQGQRGAGDGDRRRGGRVRRSASRRDDRHHRALRGDASGRRRPVQAVSIERTWWDVSRAACPSTRRARNCSRDGRRFSRRRCRPRCLNPSGRRCSVSGWTWRRSRRAFRLSAPGTAPRSWCSWA